MQFSKHFVTSIPECFFFDNPSTLPVKSNFSNSITILSDDTVFKFLWALPKIFNKISASSVLN